MLKCLSYMSKKTKPSRTHCAASSARWKRPGSSPNCARASSRGWFPRSGSGTASEIAAAAAGRRSTCVSTAPQTRDSCCLGARRRNGAMNAMDGSRAIPKCRAVCEVRGVPIATFQNADGLNRATAAVAQHAAEVAAFFGRMKVPIDFDPAAEPLRRAQRIGMGFEVRAAVVGDVLVTGRGRDGGVGVRRRRPRHALDGEDVRPAPDPEGLAVGWKPAPRRRREPGRGQRGQFSLHHRMRPGAVDDAKARRLGRRTRQICGANALEESGLLPFELVQ